MAGAGGGVQPVIVSALTGLASQVASFRPGEVLLGLIQGKPGDLTLYAGNQRVPLGDVPLTPGQVVNVEVIQTPHGPQIRISPQAAQNPNARTPESAPQFPFAPRFEAPPPEAAATPSRAGQPVQPGNAQNPAIAGQSIAAAPTPETLAPVIANVLRALESPELVRAAAQLAPRAMPPSETGVRQVLALFISRGAAGEDLLAVQASLARAVAARVVPSANAERLAALVSALVLADPADAPRVLKNLSQQLRSTPETRLARALAGADLAQIGTELETEIRTVLSRLRENPELTRFLQTRGELESFRGAIDRILDRVIGGQLQNLNRFDAPYMFIEIPVPPESPLQRVQVHFFGDGAAGRRYDPQNASIVMDLSTTRLGDLWISLNMAGGHCSCTFRTPHPEVAAAIEAGAQELVQGLSLAGYTAANVRVTMWDGDRLNEAANLLRRFSGIQLDA